VVQQAVQHRRGYDGIPQDLAPGAYGLVAGDQEAPLLVALSDQVEKEMAARPHQGQVAQLVDLCGAPHKSTYVETSVMWSTGRRRPFSAIRSQITPH